MALKIEIWSDLVCPFCYIGKRNLEAALRQFPGRDDVQILWRSFELDPDSERDPSKSVYERLAEKYGQDLAWARAMTAQVVATANAAGLHFDYDRAVSANTFDAHRLTHLAARHGRQGDAEERLMSAYFCEGKNIGDRATLLSLAAGLGLDAAEAEASLAGDGFADAVRRDEEEAYSLGINAVPFYLFNREMYVRGAQSPETFLSALQTLSAKTAG